MSGKKQLPITWKQVASLRRHSDRLTWLEISRRLHCSAATAKRIWNGGRQKAA